MNAQSATNIFKQAAGASIGWGIVMILLGVLALFLPLATGIGVSIAVAWIIVFGGIAYVASAFAARGAGSFLWRLLIGAVIFSAASIWPSIRDPHWSLLPWRWR